MSQLINLPNAANANNYENRAPYYSARLLELIDIFHLNEHNENQMNLVEEMQALSALIADRGQVEDASGVERFLCRLAAAIENAFDEDGNIINENYFSQIHNDLAAITTAINVNRVNQILAEMQNNEDEESEYEDEEDGSDADEMNVVSDDETSVHCLTHIVQNNTNIKSMHGEVLETFFSIDFKVDALVTAILSGETFNDDVYFQ